MGNKSSTSRDGSNWSQPSYGRSSSASGWQHNPETPYSQYSQNYPVQQPYPAPDPYYAPPPNYSAPSPAPPQYNEHPAYPPQKKFDRQYSRIADNYRSLDEVTEALSRAGLESSNLIVGIDFTKSNEWTGKKSYNGRSLHHIGNGLNPYEQAISIIGKTLASFDEDNLIPCFGFGDASTHDQDVFNFYPDERSCEGFEEVLSRYREIAPQLRLAGPTSFAPVIEMAMSVVEQSGGQYHVLVIIADGQVTRSVDTQNGQLSPQEQKTVQAIVEASKYPLSIILVGVGDGPWDMMREFDDNIPARDFDNFQFVNFTEIMAKKTNQSRKETEFALAALMEIPSQYKATLELHLLGRRKGIGSHMMRVALHPPIYGASSARSNSKSSVGSSSFSTNSKPFETATSFGGSSSPYGATSYQYSTSSNYEPSITSSPPASAPTSTYEHQICPICLSNPKDMAFGCGHQTCCECGEDLIVCPICRKNIETRIKLY